MKSMIALAALALAACASLSDAAESRQVPGTLVIDGNSYEVAWGVPAAAPLALAVVEHGFTRRCDNLRSTLDALADAGLLTLCINASMTAGNPDLADALAALMLGGGLSGPDGQPVPARTVVGGHSAGGAFAVRLGAQLAAGAPQRLAGALLFDPVAAAGFVEQIRALGGFGQRPVLAISANASACNAQNNAYPGLRVVAADALAGGGDGFVGLQLLQNSTHVDVEGPDSNLLGWLACGQGRPRPANVRTLRDLAATWAGDLARGLRSPEAWPGGARFEALVGRGRAIAIE